jgi:hypothetical protein
VIEEILGGSGGQIDKKKKPLIYQGFSEMEHSGIEPLTSTLPEIDIVYDYNRFSLLILL